MQLKINQFGFGLIVLTGTLISRLTSCQDVDNVWHKNPVQVTRVGAEPQQTNSSGQKDEHLEHIDLNNSKEANPTTRRSRNPTLTNGNLNSAVDPIGDDGLDLDDDDESGCDFGGQQLRVVVSPQPPLVNCLQDLYGDWLCNGSNIEVVRVLERRLNFRAAWLVLTNTNHDDELAAKVASRMTAHPSQPFGNSQAEMREREPEMSQAASSSVFNLVATGRVLMSANGVMRSLNRSQTNLIVSEPFDAFRLHFLLSKSVHDHDHLFVKPFDTKAWLGILASAALVVPIFYLINTSSAHYGLHDDRELAKVSLWLCIKQRIWLSLGRGPLRPCWRRTRSSSIDSITFERQLSEALSRTQAEANKPEVLSANHLAYSSSLALTGRTSEYGSERPRLEAFLEATTLPRGESKRRRRLLRRQWAYERRRALKASRRKRTMGFFKVAYVVWYVVASLANQGGETEDLPHANSTRILVAFWWLYLIVICAIHSGILTALLTFPRQNDFIQTLDDYLNLETRERNSLRLSVDRHSELAHLLANPDNLHKSPLQSLHNKSVPIAYVNFQRHRQRILDEVQQGRRALMEEKSTISQVITQEFYDTRQTKCLFKSSRYPIDVIPMSLVMSSSMPAACVRRINTSLKIIMRTGLAQKWRRRYESQGNDCLNTVIINAGDVDKIELKHVILAFWLLGLGIIIGLMMLVAEITWLFMFEDEEEDEDDDDDDTISINSVNSLFSSGSSSTSSSSISSTESDRVQLGFRRALNPTSQQFAAIRSLKTKRMPIRRIARRTKRTNKRMAKAVPKIVFSVEDDYGSDDQNDVGEDTWLPLEKVVVSDTDGVVEVKEVRNRHMEDRRARRLARETRKRAKRIEKTKELFKRLHGGEIYTNKMKNQMRRMSHSVMSHFRTVVDRNPGVHEMQPHLETVGHGVRRRRQESSRQGLGVRVAPI